MKIRIDIQVEHWSIDRLVPRIANPRIHTPEPVAQIAVSIAAFGFNAPVLVGSNSGLIAGHARLVAARQLGIEQVAVIVLDHLTQDPQRGEEN